MRPDLFTIRRAGPGVLSTMARPYGGPWLETAMNGLSAAGVSVLVSLLSAGEMAELELTSEPEAAQASGIAFYHLPTPDRTVPDRVASLELAQKLRAHLAQGAGIAVHCRYGIGRSSTLAAMVMVLEGTEPEQAWSLISAARGTTVPDTVAQREAIADLWAARLGTPPALGQLFEYGPDPADA